MIIITLLGIISLINFPVDDVFNDIEISRTSKMSSNEIDVLYIYHNGTNYYEFPKMKALFDTNSKIKMDGINITDFVVNTSIADDYKVIIVGMSSFGRWDETNATRANAIVNVGKPILAIGQGGATFFQSLGIDYGGAAMGWDCYGIKVNTTDATHGIFSQTYTFPVPGDILINGSHNKNVGGIYMGNTFPFTEYLASDATTYNKTHAPLAEYSGFTEIALYLGFWFSPTTANDNLYKIIHNALEWLAGPPNPITVKITSPMNLSTVRGDLIVSFNFTGGVDLDSAEILVDDQPFPIPYVISLIDTNGSSYFDLNMSDPIFQEDTWYIFTIVVSDVNGWEGESSILVFRDEYYPPIVSLISPNNRSNVAGVATFEFSITTDHLVYVDYYIDETGRTTVLDPNGFYDGVFHIDVNTSNLSNGTHTLKLVVQGIPNHNTTVYVLFDVDNTLVTTIVYMSPGFKILWILLSFLLVVPLNRYLRRK